MTQPSYREGRTKVTEEIKRAVSRLLDQDKDWENKKKHPSRWYRTETARILGLDENSNPSLRSYEELVRDVRKNARVQNPVDKPWNTALLNSETLVPDLIPWIVGVQYHLKKYLSKPLTIREVKDYTSTSTWTGTTYSTHHTTYNIQHTTYNIQHSNTLNNLRVACCSRSQ